MRDETAANTAANTAYHRRRCPSPLNLGPPRYPIDQTKGQGPADRITFAADEPKDVRIDRGTDDKKAECAGKEL